MNEEERMIVKQAVHEALHDHFFVEMQEHRDDHKWVREQRERQERRAIAIETTKANLIDWGIKASIATILAIIWYAMNHWKFH